MSLLLASIGFGLVSAAVLALAAVGFTLQFAVADVLNLAYGAVMMWSAYVVYWVNRAGVPVWIGLVAGAAAGAGLSLALNQGIYTPFQRRRAAPIVLVIVALGVTLVLEFGLQAIVGGTAVSYTMGTGPMLRAGGLDLSAAQLVIIALAVAAMLGIHLLLRHTRLGKAMRATAANRPLARACGIRSGRVIMLTWGLSGALCGVAGGAFAIDAGSFGATSADLFLVLILAAVFLGGPGQPYGAMLGALVIGLGTEVSAAYVNPQYKDVIAFLLLLAMLALRPAGLLGRRA
jgi:branched-subunit amino acid ABC-type transport system permease component